MLDVHERVAFSALVLGNNRASMRRRDGGHYYRDALEHWHGNKRQDHVSANGRPVLLLDRVRSRKGVFV